MANELMRQALAHDASHFAVVPDAVVRADNIEHVASLLKAETRRGLSLSGAVAQACRVRDKGRGLLVDVETNFRGVEVRDDGGRVTCQPGTTLRYTNAVLSPYHRKLGPDPASEGAATIGGVVANNSSGMTCGTELNSYETIDSLTVVLPSGTTIKTGAADADHHLHSRENAISTGLLDLRARIMQSCPDLVGHIRRQFSLKNTMDTASTPSSLYHATPAEILEHLLIGSEGTLGFVGSATFRTVEKKTYASTALLVFSSVFDAMSSLEALKGTGASAIELMDAQSLTVGKVIPGVPGLVRDLDVFGQAALPSSTKARRAMSWPNESGISNTCSATSPLIRRLTRPRIQQPAPLYGASVKGFTHRWLVLAPAAARRSWRTWPSPWQNSPTRARKLRFFLISSDMKIP